MSPSLYVGPDTQPDKYRLVRSVGRGGEATLYLAEVTLAGQTEPVVVKALHPDLTADDEKFADLSARWAEQAELLRFINRLGVVGVREHFEGAPEHPADGAAELNDRALYLVMNYVEGLDLRDWRAENPVEGVAGQRRVLRFLEQVAQVLDLLHSGRATPSKRVVVHGDLSPGNIMVSEEGQATLVDFGLSRIAARHMTARPWFTPGYAAPEIFTGEYSAATDRYAFGAIAYFALTGEDPPPAPEQLRERFGALPLLAEAEEGQRELVMSMFSIEPSERPESSAWVRILRSLATSAPWTGPVADPGAAPEPGEDGLDDDALPEPGEALAAAAVFPGGSTSVDTPEGAPPRGPRFSGPAPTDTGAQDVAAAGPEVDDAPGGAAPGTGEDASDAEEPMSKRPVGGMRGRPVQEPRPPAPRPLPEPGPSSEAPVPTPATPPMGVSSASRQGPPPSRPPRSGPPAGARAGYGPPSGPQNPPPGGPVPGPSGPWSRATGPGSYRNTPAHGAPGHSAPVHSGPVQGGAPQGYNGSGPVPPRPEPAAEKPKRRSRKPMMIGLAIFAVVFMIVGGGGTYLFIDRVLPLFSDEGGRTVEADAREEPSESPENEAQAQPDPSEKPEKEPSDEPEGGSSGAPSGGETLLTQMEAVDQSNNDYWRPETGRADIDGQAYNRALISGFCKTYDSRCSGWMDYNLGRDWNTFTATIGVEDSSSSSATTTFLVLVDGEQKVTETLRLGEVKEIEVSVENALRLRVEVESDGTGVYPVWADPVLTKD
ncbi:protein kinase domain-containing protein [Nocardiopsis sp. LDBS1602]|uniref:protein kinase domain-containing protein n=1 Tax=Nocardiopsis sp. LDBS1602 TaxID=3109597 RepID=UPI002DB9FB4C|nr:protein kinase [Nocardiopsis sp. LDBS1602]MEC3891989.1 protein kinase [Nocardiopsis sp. LDBS1602]